MFKHLLSSVVCALALSVAAKAELIPTGATRFDPLPTIVAAPGETVTLQAWLSYRVKDTEAKGADRYQWLRLAKVPVEFYVNIHGRKEMVVDAEGNTPKTGPKGRAKVNVTIDETVKHPKNYTYWALFQGGTYKPLGKPVYLHRSSDSGRLQVN